MGEGKSAIEGVGPVESIVRRGAASYQKAVEKVLRGDELQVMDEMEYPARLLRTARDLREGRCL